MGIVRVSERPAVAMPVPETEIAKSAKDLRQQLTSAAPAKRRQAVRDLSHLPEGALIIAGYLKSEAEPSVCNVMLTVLIDQGSAAVVEALLPYLETEDARLRNLVLEALLEMPVQVSPYLKDLLQHADSDVQIFAVNLLAGQPKAIAFDHLSQVLLHGEHPNLCAAAIDCLAEIGTPDCTDLLQAVAGRFPNHPFIGYAAKAALWRIGDRI